MPPPFTASPSSQSIGAARGRWWRTRAVRTVGTDQLESRSRGRCVGRMFLHLSLLLALVGPLGHRLGGRPNLLPTTTGARRRGVSAALQVAMSGIGPVRTPSPKLPKRRPASMVFTKEDPTPTVELYADGTVNQYTSTLTSLRANYKLSTRDVRLLRSSTRVLAPREEYVIFDLGDLKGVLQRDRVILIGADRPAATALADELRQRLVVERDDRELERETPFEVRVVECMLEQTYSLLEEALQRLETMVTDGDLKPYPYPYPCTPIPLPLPQPQPQPLPSPSPSP